MRATYSPSTRGMHHISLRQGLRPFSASRRRTVSPDRLSCPVSLTMASAKSSSVQRARPSGGFAQAVATSKASSLPVSLRSAPGRGSSLSARSRLPSTKRRLVRYTVEPPTATVRAISSSLQPASAASNIWARLSLRAARLPLLNIAVSSPRSAWLSSAPSPSAVASTISARQPGLPLKKGRAQTMTHDYKRNGTTTLFAALDVKTGKVIGECVPRHRAKEFISFLKKIDTAVDRALDVHAICDNYKTHKTKEVQAWLVKHPRFKLHF